MRIFVTGATGFIGSVIVQDLIQAGHQVLGLTRSDAGAESLQAAGAEVHRGNLEDADSLRSGAAKVDGVIHTAFDHTAFSGDFSKFAEYCELDRRAIETLGGALSGSDRPLIVTSGTAMANSAPGQAAVETTLPDPKHPFPRVASELAALAMAERGVKVSIMRLPQVHNTEKQGLVTYAVSLAREKGVSAYVGEGSDRWPAAHVMDTAQLYRLAVEKAGAGAIYHAVAEEGVSMRAIAEAIGRALKVPAVSIAQDAAAGHFGWLGMFIGRDMPASSALTREQLGWHPTGPGMIADLEQMR